MSKHQRHDPDHEKYLYPTQLCDFDRHPEIRDKALELTLGRQAREDRLQGIYHFVKELPFGLEDWDVRASETLSKGWGMCSGKTNLLVAMLRSIGIPARYRIYRVKAENILWKALMNDQEAHRHLETIPLEQDHVDCEAWLGSWSNFDAARDSALERGMLALRIPLQREPIVDDTGQIPYLILTSFDDWAKERQHKRGFRENRYEIFTTINERFSKIRAYLS